ncbi:MAG: methylenetetrahydrofolate reductase [NAD(P)H] [Zetaproteobacteria bacterium]|nr:MAG: methylenetetrahydrofolate reductase [NAD(P)H] [Zetaproteobacteria bacterium]
MSKATFSFEFFPPKTEKAADKLWGCVAELVKLDPKFMTVTYGAGGTTRDGTIDTIAKKMEMTNIPIGSHLTFLNTTKDELYKYVDGLWERGVKHIVALRGDMPNDLEWPLAGDENYFQYTSDFVEGLLARHPFEISVGAYPEKHPDSKTLNADVHALQLKCEAGATRALTQFFFDNDVYYNFVEKCEKVNIRTQICPGLLPIHDFKSMCNFAKRCEANVPLWLHEKFEGLDDKPEEARKVAIDLLVKQSEDLVKNGVEHIHYYTLNKSDITTQAVDAIS